tara:strand:- start:2272 stop:2565 length:294 start_codon:yes stop_codon:yes gene_type:complete
MAIKKKTKAQKDQDKKDLERAQLALFEAAQAFQREVWECEWDLEWIRLKDLTNLFSKIRNVDWALDRSKASQVYTEWDDVKDIDNRNDYSPDTHYKD